MDELYYSCCCVHIRPSNHVELMITHQQCRRLLLCGSTALRIRECTLGPVHAQCMVQGRGGQQYPIVAGQPNHCQYPTEIKVCVCVCVCGGGGGCMCVYCWLCNRNQACIHIRQSDHHATLPHCHMHACVYLLTMPISSMLPNKALSTPK